jgi:putative membrane protein
MHADEQPAAPPAEPESAYRPGGAVELVRHAVFGFLMGCADTVPGVSGGTVAFVCGIYGRLIDAIRDGSRVLSSALKGDRRAAVAGLRALDLRLLVPLLGGIGVAVVALASAIEHLLEESPESMAALFTGLVAGSVVVSWGLLRRPDRRTVAIVVLATAATFLLLGLKESTTAEAGDPTAPLWAYPLAASIAICAMILPGVSGSFLLVTMGMYDDVLGAVNERDVLALVLFMLGAVAGLAVFSRVLAWLMDHHHDMVVAAMIGLMLGSIRLLWPWPDGVSSSELGRPEGAVALAAVLAAVGFVVVLVIGRLGVLEEEELPHPG